MQTILLGLYQTLAFVSFFAFPLGAAELSEPIPLHQRPDYILESPDIISKEYHVVFLSQRFGEQRMVFPFTGHETVVKAIQKLNSDELKQLAPDTSNNLLIIRPVSQMGKPAEFIPVDFQAIVDATVDITDSETISAEKVDIPLKAGDTLLLSQNYQPEDLRPDSAVRIYPPILHDRQATGPPDIATNSFSFDDADVTPPRAEISSVEKKFLRRHQAEVPTIKKKRDSSGSQSEKHGKGKYIARSVFFEQDAVPIEQFIVNQPSSFQCGGVLTDLIEQVRSKVSITIVVSGTKETGIRGYWLVLFGEEAKVKELRTVFSQIAEKKP